MSIKQIETLLPADLIKNKKIIDVSVSNLVGPGENFGSEISKVDLTLNDQQTIHAVAKQLSQSEFYQKSFEVQKTFRAEINFYSKLIPALQSFQKRHQHEEILDCFGGFYGGRINLNGGDVVDEDGVILLHNLKVAGYRTVDRYIGLSLDESRVVVSKLAQLHALPVAVKLLEPDLFSGEIRPMLSNEIMQQEKNPFLNNELLIEDIVWESDKCAVFVPQLKKMWRDFRKNMNYERREPFATFCHGDLWINNLMIKHEKNSIDVKFIDFQGYDYKSPAVDLLYLLFTSVQIDVLRDEFDNLLKVYHSSFIKVLRDLGCDVEPFNYLNFLEELRLDAPLTFYWCPVFLSFVVYGPKEPQNESEEAEIPFHDRKFRDEVRKFIDNKAKEKIHLMVEIFARKKWL